MISDTWNKLRDPEYRKAFVASQINIGIPFQIKALMKTRSWTQEKLAEKTGMRQPSISGLITPGKTRPNIETLRRLADAFDCGLAVRFVPFSDLVRWSDEFDPDAFAIPEFEKDREIAKHNSEMQGECDAETAANRRHQINAEAIQEELVRVLAERADALAPLESQSWGAVASVRRSNTQLHSSLAAFNAAPVNIGNLKRGTPNPPASGVVSSKPNWGKVRSVEEFRNQPHRRFGHKGSGYGRGNRERRARA